MRYTSQQVIALAPDPASVKAGQKLARTRYWKNQGQNAGALWGECQGSALYQVYVDLATLSAICTCPSRKFPCKHGIGLLLLALNSPSAVPAAEAPEWVAALLAKRKAAEERKAAKKAKAGQPPTAAQLAAHAKTAEKRRAQILLGLDSLDLWLDDLIANGLASVENPPWGFWEQEATRMIDAQAPGLAARLRQIAALPRTGTGWPERLLTELGRLALLSAAFRRLDTLDPALREDVRQLVGVALNKDQLAEHGGELIVDDWLVLGQTVEDDPHARMLARRSWLQGARSGRIALELEYTMHNTPFAEPLPAGATLPAALRFWPSAYPIRARIEERRGELTNASAPLTGLPTFDAFFDAHAQALARQPWLDAFPAVLCGVTPLVTENGGAWRLRDQTGAALPLEGGPHWRLLLLSAGYPVDVAGVWDGRALTLLGVRAEGVYTSLTTTGAA